MMQRIVTQCCRQFGVSKVAQMPQPSSSEGRADDTDAKILDAALALFAEVGIRRTSTDDIAKRAGVNRATLYRRLGAKEHIVRQAMLRETTRVLGEIAEQVRPVIDVAERITAGFVITVTALRTNPILEKALVVDLEETLAAITVDAGDLLALATEFVSDQIVSARDDSEIATDAADLAAIIVRLVHSLVLTRDAPPRLTTDAELRDFAARNLVPLIQT